MGRLKLLTIVGILLTTFTMAGCGGGGGGGGDTTPDGTLTFYVDLDGDGYGDVTDTTVAETPPEGYVSLDGDCDDTNSDINPGATEVYDSIDNNCDGTVDEGVETWYVDADQDGVPDEDGATVEAIQQPVGYALPTGTSDCDDNDANNYPGNVENPNDASDNDCDGTIDERFYYSDEDNDGYGNPSNSLEDTTLPAGYVADDTDCDDADSAINPGAEEVFDSIDNNCNGIVDEGFTSTTYYQDSDGDGYGNANETMDGISPPAGYVIDDTDCNDNDSTIYPGAQEIAGDSIDQDCDGSDAQLSVALTLHQGDFDSNTNVVNLLFQAADGTTAEPIDYLVDSQFELLEDGFAIGTGTGYEEYFREVLSGDALNKKFQTVLLLDISSSVDATELETLKDAARRMIAAHDENGELIRDADGRLTSLLLPGQQVKIVTFDLNRRTIVNWSDNPIELLNAIDTIRPGDAKTALYDAVYNEIRSWNNTLIGDTLTQGSMVVITDGSDNASSYTLDEVIAYRGNKAIYAVGVGSQVDETALRELASTGAYLYASNFDLISDTLAEAQRRMAAFADSFYFLYYYSPSTTTFNVDLSVIGNNNTGTDATISQTFSGGSGTIRPEIIVTGPKDIREGESFQLSAKTWWIREASDYTWVSGNLDVTVDTTGSDDASEVTIYAHPSDGVYGPVTIDVTDIGNTYWLGSDPQYGENVTTTFSFDPWETLVHRYGASGNVNALYSLATTTEGGLIMAGATDSFQYASSYNNFYLVKTSASGIEQWYNTFSPGSTTNDSANCVIQTSDGGYLLAGTSDDGSDLKGYVVKTDAIGDEVWSSTYDGASLFATASSSTSIEACIETASGGYAFAGTIFDDTGDDSMYLLTVDADGTNPVERIFEHPTAGGDTRANELIQTAAGDFVLAGNRNTAFGTRYAYAIRFTPATDSTPESSTSRQDTNVTNFRDVLELPGGNILFLGNDSVCENDASTLSLLGSYNITLANPNFSLHSMVLRSTGNIVVAGNAGLVANSSGAKVCLAELSASDYAIVDETYHGGYGSDDSAFAVVETGSGDIAFTVSSSTIDEAILVFDDSLAAPVSP
ncbi:MAG: hypothetical protein C0624_10795 [Desulfuromonas sp.]|nr:MAG: hypothetical protein C0624_10795 [Desulfuromonas sp.]